MRIFLYCDLSNFQSNRLNLTRIKSIQFLTNLVVFFNHRNMVNYFYICILCTCLGAAVSAPYRGDEDYLARREAAMQEDRKMALGEFYLSIIYLEKKLFPYIFLIIHDHIFLSSIYIERHFILSSKSTRSN